MEGKMLAHSNNGDFPQVTHSAPAVGPYSSVHEDKRHASSLPLNFSVLFHILHLLISNTLAYIPIWQDYNNPS